MQPVHAAALGPPVTVPDGPISYLMAVVSVAATDELDALLAGSGFGD